jgi:hypothetical protein
MALAEILLAQAGTLLDIASRDQTSETAEKMRGMAREFVELAHREAQVCSFPVVLLGPRREQQRGNSTSSSGRRSFATVMMPAASPTSCGTK